MWYVCEFYTMRSPILFCLGKFVAYISYYGVILPIHLNYIWVFIYMFVHHTTMSTLICLFMLYNLIVGCNLSWIFPLYLSYVWDIIPLYCNYIHNCINIFVNVISIFTEICWCYLYDLNLGCNTYLGNLSCIFTVYDMWCHCSHPHWPTFTKLDWHILKKINWHMH